MIKSLMAGVAALAFASAAFAQNPHDNDNSGAYNNAATSSVASGAVNSQSFATATSSGNGTAFTATQSGSFATFGQVSTFTPATNATTGGSNTIGGTAAVEGFTSTAGYVTSTSQTTGTASASSQSWNSANAVAQSYVGVSTSGVGSGAATGAANSASAGNASTASANGVNSGAIQGNSESNVNAYSASDSAILFTSTVTVNGVVVPVTNVQTQTSATAQSDSSVQNETVFGTTPVANVGTGTNQVTANSGTATADAN